MMKLVDITHGSALLSGARVDTIAVPDSTRSRFQDFLADQNITPLGGVAHDPRTGISQLGLLDWVQAERQRTAEEQARLEVMNKWGLKDEEAVSALTARQRAAFDAEVRETTDEKMAEALKEDALNEMHDAESRLYRQTPPPPKDDDTAFF